MSEKEEELLKSFFSKFYYSIDFPLIELKTYHINC